MSREVKTLLFAALLAALLWFSWRVLAPFLPGSLWAAALVVTFRPLHEALARRLHGRAWLASTLLTLAVAAFVVVPIVIAAVQVTQGSVRVYEWVQTTYADKGPGLGAAEHWPVLAEWTERAKQLIGLANVDLQATALDLVKKVGAFSAAKVPVFVGGALGLVFSFFVMLAMMFVLFAQGGGIAAELVTLLPLPREDAERIVRETGVMTRSLFKSVGLTALIQAVLGGAALLVLGVPHAFTFGAAMFFAAFLPGGTAIVWFPVAIWLAAIGHEWRALILFLWGAGVVGTIDNVLRPFLAKDGVKLSGMMLFFGLFGGLIAFGLVGLLAGPIVLYVTREMLEVLHRERQAA